MAVFNKNVFNPNVFNTDKVIGRAPKPLPPEFPPEIISSRINVSGLNIVDLRKRSLFYPTLNLSKLDRINVLMTNLNISLPESLRLFIDSLSTIYKKGRKVSVSDLGVIYGTSSRIPTQYLKIIKDGKLAFVVDEVNIIAEMRRAIEANVPNIHILNMKKLAEYLELISLLDELEG